MAGGFPRVVFPPAVCGGCAPLRSFDPLVALLSWVHHSSLWASERQTWAGSSLADAGAPQLHALAPLQQRRWPAHRPAHVTLHTYIHTQLWATSVGAVRLRSTGPTLLSLLFYLLFIVVVVGVSICRCEPLRAGCLAWRRGPVRACTRVCWCCRVEYLYLHTHTYIHILYIYTYTRFSSGSGQRLAHTQTRAQRETSTQAASYSTDFLHHMPSVKPGGDTQPQQQRSNDTSSTRCSSGRRFGSHFDARAKRHHHASDSKLIRSHALPHDKNRPTTHKRTHRRTNDARHDDRRPERELVCA